MISVPEWFNLISSNVQNSTFLMFP